MFDFESLDALEAHQDDRHDARATNHLDSTAATRLGGGKAPGPGVEDTGGVKTGYVDYVVTREATAKAFVGVLVDMRAKEFVGGRSGDGN
mmetsp:Transcript_45212/g.127979  ORF Transcript_45212/g.127979 Transcript_45212/m.127979 type:complete len:90 (-) Transcript_45212:2-271(-)